MVSLAKLSVPSMMCGGCKGTVETALALPGVHGVEFDLAAKQVSVMCSPETKNSALLAALSKAGKEATLISRTEMSALRAWAMTNWKSFVVIAALIPPAVALALTRNGGGASSSATSTNGATLARGLSVVGDTTNNNLVASRITSLTTRYGLSDCP